MTIPLRAVCVFLCLLAILAGCSRETGRLSVKGSVTFKGLPLPHGNIQFFPLEEGKGESAGAMISKGSFEIPADKGMLSGKYKVVISCAEEMKNPPKNLARGSSPPTEEKLPPEFSSFEKTRATAEVTSAGKNIFDFTIP
ncbi:MAG: hypothetical protein RIR17_933 [Planctomycetota bacterium]|jgi:hypothetical protein